MMDEPPTEPNGASKDAQDKAPDEALIVGEASVYPAEPTAGHYLQVPAPVPEPLPASPPVEPAPRPWHHHADLGGLRVLIVVWCFWLLGAWATAWLNDTSVPRVRWMLFAGVFGLMLVWPAFRLSERLELGDWGRAVWQVLLDWLALAAVYQAVIWSLHFGAGWRLERGVWLASAVVAWSLLSALIVAVARLWPGGAARVTGMLLCIALVFAEPLAVWFTLNSGGAGWTMRLSPVHALWELSATPGPQRVSPWDKQVLMIALLAVMGWAALSVWALGERLLHRRALPEA